MTNHNLQLNANFQKIFIELTKKLQMNDMELAELLDVSKPSINRWKVCKNLPILLVRNRIIHQLENQILKQATNEKNITTEKTT